MRYFFAGNSRRGIPDQLVESRTFAKYLYRWGAEYFFVYVVQIGFYTFQYILKEPAEGETIMSRNSVTDKLIATCGDWQKPDDKYIYVYDIYWQASRALYLEVQKANWDDVGVSGAIISYSAPHFESQDMLLEQAVPIESLDMSHDSKFSLGKETLTRKITAGDIE